MNLSASELKIANATPALTQELQLLKNELKKRIIEYYDLFTTGFVVAEKNKEKVHEIVENLGFSHGSGSGAYSKGELLLHSYYATASMHAATEAFILRPVHIDERKKKLLKALKKSFPYRVKVDNPGTPYIDGYIDASFAEVRKHLNSLCEKVYVTKREFDYILNSRKSVSVYFFESTYIYVYDDTFVKFVIAPVPSFIDLKHMVFR